MDSALQPIPGPGSSVYHDALHSRVMPQVTATEVDRRQKDDTGVEPLLVNYRRDTMLAHSGSSTPSENPEPAPQLHWEASHSLLHVSLQQREALGGGNLGLEPRSLQMAIYILYWLCKLGLDFFFQ